MTDKNQTVHLTLGQALRALDLAMMAKNLDQATYYPDALLDGIPKVIDHKPSGVTFEYVKMIEARMGIRRVEYRQADDHNKRYIVTVEVKL